MSCFIAIASTWMGLDELLTSAIGPQRTYRRSPGQAVGIGGRLCPTCQERMPTGSNYCFGTGIGRMLETFQPSAVLRRTWFIRNVVVCAG